MILAITTPYPAGKQVFSRDNPVTPVSTLHTTLPSTIECGSQIASDLHSMNRFVVDGRHLVNPVRL